MKHHVTEFTIRNVEMSDLDQIAEIHRASFADRALSQLGRAAIKRYYQWLITGFPNNYHLCASLDDGQISGFCFAGVYAGSFSGFLKQNRGFLMGNVLIRPWLIFNPIVREQSTLAIKTLLKQFKNINKIRPSNQNKKEKVGKSRKSFGILAIAVNPSFQQQGVGQILMATTETKALAEGYKQMHLSVHPDNIPAIRFYEKLGWQKNPPGENWSGKMTKLIS